PRNGDKERMEVGTIAPLRIGSPKHVPVPPARAGLVIAHVVEYVVVDGAGLVELRGLVSRDLGGEVGRPPGDGNKLVRAEILAALLFAEGHVLQARMIQP